MTSLLEGYDEPARSAAGVGSTRDAPNLAMRRQRRELALSSDVAERIAAGSGSEKSTDRVTERRWAFDPKITLVPDGSGGYVIRDIVASIKVARDGTVRISDASDFSARINLPTPNKLFRRGARDFAAWLADPYRETRVGRTQDLPAHLRAVPGGCDSVGSPACLTSDDLKKMWEIEEEAWASGTLLSGRADLSGYLQRKFVGDPHASRKLKILDQTRDERARLGDQFRLEQRARSPELMRRNLDAVMRATNDLRARRAAVLALFDECENDNVGQRARVVVVGWIRAHLANAFTREELAELDRRSGR